MLPLQPTAAAGCMRGDGIAEFGVIDDHKEALTALAETELAPTGHDRHDEHDHSHSDSSGGDCVEPACTDATHDHSHRHEHTPSGDACDEPACTDPTHDHSHTHSHAAKCAEPECTDPTHDHSHTHGHADDCAEPGCTDPTHDHSHTHDHGGAGTTAAARFGVTNFVYRRRRPFHPGRLVQVLKQVRAFTVNAKLVRMMRLRYAWTHAHGVPAGVPLALHST
jgi:hypothetical protein